MVMDYCSLIALFGAMSYFLPPRTTLMLSLFFLVFLAEDTQGRFKGLYKSLDEGRRGASVRVYARVVEGVLQLMI